MSAADEKEHERWGRGVLRLGLLPFLGYVACYFILTYPLVLSFSSHYFCDLGDGLQMIWNIWWVRHAMVDLHQLPWHTSMLHYPAGATLLLHSLSPFNGFIAIPISLFCTPIQTYNTIVTLAFALSGLTAFWLAYDMTRAYWPSLAAGYAFAFSAIHFAHEPGHLHQISSEIGPLFLLLWLRLLRRPAIGLALGAAIALFLVLLCDHYLFLFCVMAMALSIAWHLIRNRGLAEWKTHGGLVAAICFVIAAGLTSGVLVFAMAQAAKDKPFVGMHDPEFYSADVVGLFVPGSTWQYRSLTRSIWPPLGEPAEKNTSLGLALIVAAAYGCTRRAREEIKAAGFWITLVVVFTALSLGPTLQFRGTAMTGWMPYRLFERILPPIRMSGCPSRMLVMTELALGVLAAGGLKRLGEGGGVGEMLNRKRKMLRFVIAGVFVLALVIESQPAVQICVNPEVPRWVQILRDDPTPGAVMDAVDGGESAGLYYQTIHHRPMASGYLSRVLVRLDDEWHHRLDLLQRGDISSFKDFRFIVIRANDPPLPLAEVFADRTVRVYRMP
jgi:hypothetical protein